MVRLKVRHIDSAQKIIRVEQSKGRKDRNVMLSPETLDLLRQWWRTKHRVTTPQRRFKSTGCFPGRKPDQARDAAREFHPLLQRSVTMADTDYTVPVALHAARRPVRWAASRITLLARTSHTVTWWGGGLRTGQTFCAGRCAFDGQFGHWVH